jgi:hypothetical protein
MTETIQKPDLRHPYWLGQQLLDVFGIARDRMIVRLEIIADGKTVTLKTEERVNSDDAKELVTVLSNYTIVPKD